MNGTTPLRNCTTPPPTPPPGFWMSNLVDFDFSNSSSGSGSGSSSAVRCYDVPGWIDDLGDSCATYTLNSWCGRGFTADKACCACGGGIRAPLDPIPVLAHVHPNCTDGPPLNWTDSLGYPCKHYVGGIYDGDDAFRPYLCAAGRRFAHAVAGTNQSRPLHAMQACCGCGGGGIPAVVLAVVPPPIDYCEKEPSIALGGAGGLLACHTVATVLTALALVLAAISGVRRWRRRRRQSVEAAWDAKLAAYAAADKARMAEAGAGAAAPRDLDGERLYARRGGKIVPSGGARVSVLVDRVTGRHADVDVEWECFTPSWRGRAFYVHAVTGEFAFTAPPGYIAYQVWLNLQTVGDVRDEAALFKEHRAKEAAVRGASLYERLLGGAAELAFQLRGCRCWKRRRRRNNKLHPTAHEPPPLKELRVLSAETNKNLPAPAWA